MKNLKRILSLALAGTMLVGMMVVGASAADFTDAGDIEHLEAVETLTALGVVHGNPQTDGTVEFNPEGKLTRVELATMLAIIANKGTVPTWAVKEKPTFTDVAKGYWGEAAIEYCANLGIVNGYPQADGTKTFAPTANVSATEAARMILNMMGYTIEGGRDWALDTEVQARDENLNLYDGLDEIVTNQAISRDNVAQMLYTALKADMSGDNTYKTIANVYGTRYSISVNETGAGAITGADATEKAANKAKLEAMTFTAATDATAMAATYGLTASTHYIIAKDDRAVVGTTTVDKAESLGHKYLSMEEREIDRLETVKLITSGADKGKYSLNGTYTVDDDLSDLIGQTVVVICKVNASGAVTKVYGAYGAGNVLVEDATVGDIVTASGKTTVGGFELDGSYVAKNVNTATAADLTNPAASLKAIDNDGDNKIDVLVVTPYVVGTVTYLNDTTISVPAASILSAKRTSVKTYEGIAQGDTVIATPADNTVDGAAVLVKAQTVSGSISSVQNTNDVRIDGVWYKAAGTVAGGKLSKTDLGEKKTLTLWNGYYIATAAYTENEDSSVDLVYVIQAANKSGSQLDNNGNEANLLFLNSNKPVRADIVLPDGKNTTDVDGKLCTYTEKDGVYTIKSIVADGDELKGYEAVTVGSGAFVADDDEVNGKRLADDTTVVVLYKHKTSTTEDTATFDVKDLKNIEILTGKDVKAWSADFGKAAHTYVLTAKVNGLEYAKTVILVSAVQELPNASGSETLGYVVSDVTLENDGKNTYALYTIWTGTENVNVKDEAGASVSADVKKGALIKYEDKGDGVIETDTQASPAITLVSGAITGYSAADSLLEIATENGTDSGAKELAEHPQVFFIDSANNTGAATGTIRLADKSGDALVLNVMFALNGDNKTVDYLVVDVNNVLAGELPAYAGATTVGASSVALNLNDIKGMADGLYKAATGATKGTGFESDNFGDIEKVLFFNATAGAAGSYKLEIKKAADDSTVYEETATLTRGQRVTFRVDTVATAPGIGDASNGSNKWETNTTMSAAGTYTYTITGPDSTVVLIGSFTK